MKRTQAKTPESSLFLVGDTGIEPVTVDQWTADLNRSLLLFYGNERLGYNVNVPIIFTKVVLLPENGDGMVLESEERR